MNALLVMGLLACNRGDGPLLPTASAPEATDADRAPAPPTGPRREMRFAEHGERVAAADLDGDGVDTLLYVREGVLFAGTDELASIGGKLHVVARGDIDGDGDEEAVLGFGTGRGFRSALAEVWAVHADRAERLWFRDGERNQITDLHVVDGRIFLAVYGTEKGVEGGWLDDGVFTPLGEAHMGVAQHPLTADGEVLVGRLYGEESRSDGDLQVRKADRVLETLPSLRGVKSVLVTELDGDPDPEALVGDGWHYQYGLRAQGRLLLLDGPNLEHQRTIALLDDYSVNRIEVIRDKNPARRRLLLTGARSVHVLERDALGWADTRLEAVAETGNAVVAYLEDGPWALISGTPATLVPIGP